MERKKKKEKYNYSKQKAELSIQFWWNKKEYCWNLLLTKNKKREPFSYLVDPMIFGESLAKTGDLDENDKQFLKRVFRYYLIYLEKF